MPIVGQSSPPAFAPPAGTQWVLQRNVLVYDGSGQAPQGIQPLADQTVIREYGSTYGHPDQSDLNGYSLGNLYRATVDIYEDATLVATMAVDWAPTWASPNNPAESGYVKVDGGDVVHFTSPLVGAGTAWPRVFSFTYTTTMDLPGGLFVGTWLMTIYGDVWVALPASSRLATLNPTSSSLDPERAGLEITWVQRNGRVPVALPQRGAIGALTWPRMGWSSKHFLVDGYRVTAEALPSGGWTAELDTYLTRIPGDAATELTPPGSETGVTHLARTDIDNTDDALALTA